MTRLAPIPPLWRWESCGVRRAALTVLCLTVTACSKDSSPSATTSKTSVQVSRSEAAVDSGSPSTRSALDLHTVEWTTITAPGEACLTSGQVQLHANTAFGGKQFGTALIPDEERGSPEPPGAQSGPRYDRLNLSVDAITYGDIDDDGQDEALVPLSCSNNGGTASGALLYSMALYSGGNGTLHYLGLITPQQQPADQLPTGLSDPVISHAQIVVDEAWYGPGDGTCCPSGRAVTTWTYSSGQLQPHGTRITSQSASS